MLSSVIINWQSIELSDKLVILNSLRGILLNRGSVLGHSTLNFICLTIARVCKRLMAIHSEEVIQWISQLTDGIDQLISQPNFMPADESITALILIRTISDESRLFSGLLQLQLSSTQVNVIRNQIFDRVITPFVPTIFKMLVSFIERATLSGASMSDLFTKDPKIAVAIEECVYIISLGLELSTTTSLVEDDDIANDFVFIPDSWLPIFYSPNYTEEATEFATMIKLIDLKKSSMPNLPGDLPQSPEEEDEILVKNLPKNQLCAVMTALMGGLRTILVSGDAESFAGETRRRLVRIMSSCRSAVTYQCRVLFKSLSQGTVSIQDALSTSNLFNLSLLMDELEKHIVNIQSIPYRIRKEVLDLDASFASDSAYVLISSFSSVAVRGIPPRVWKRFASLCSSLLEVSHLSENLYISAVRLLQCFSKGIEALTDDQSSCLSSLTNNDYSVFLSTTQQSWNTNENEELASWNLNASGNSVDSALAAAASLQSIITTLVISILRDPVKFRGLKARYHRDDLEDEEDEHNNRHLSKNSKFAQLFDNDESNDEESFILCRGEGNQEQNTWIEHLDLQVEESWLTMATLICFLTTSNIIQEVTPLSVTSYNAYLHAESKSDQEKWSDIFQVVCGIACSVWSPPYGQLDGRATTANSGVVCFGDSRRELRYAEHRDALLNFCLSFLIIAEAECSRCGLLQPFTHKRQRTFGYTLWFSVCAVISRVCSTNCCENFGTHGGVGLWDAMSSHAVTSNVLQRVLSLMFALCTSMNDEGGDYDSKVFSSSSDPFKNRSQLSLLTTALIESLTQLDRSSGLSIVLVPVFQQALLDIPKCLLLNDDQLFSEMNTNRYDIYNGVINLEKISTEINTLFGNNDNSNTVVLHFDWRNADIKLISTLIKTCHRPLRSFAFLSLSSPSPSRSARTSLCASPSGGGTSTSRRGSLDLIHRSSILSSAHNLASPIKMDSRKRTSIVGFAGFGANEGETTLQSDVISPPAALDLKPVRGDLVGIPQSLINVEFALVQKRIEEGIWMLAPFSTSKITFTLPARRELRTRAWNACLPSMELAIKLTAHPGEEEKYFSRHSSILKHLTIVSTVCGLPNLILTAEATSGLQTPSTTPRGSMSNSFAITSFTSTGNSLNKTKSQLDDLDDQKTISQRFEILLKLKKSLILLISRMWRYPSVVNPVLKAIVGYEAQSSLSLIESSMRSFEENADFADPARQFAEARKRDLANLKELICELIRFAGTEIIPTILPLSSRDVLRARMKFATKLSTADSWIFADALKIVGDFLEVVAHEGCFYATSNLNDVDTDGGLSTDVRLLMQRVLHEAADLVEFVTCPGVSVALRHTRGALASPRRVAVSLSPFDRPSGFSDRSPHSIATSTAKTLSSFLSSNPGAWQWLNSCESPFGEDGCLLRTNKVSLAELRRSGIIPTPLSTSTIMQHEALLSSLGLDDFPALPQIFRLLSTHSASRPLPSSVRVGVAALEVQAMCCVLLSRCVLSDSIQSCLKTTQNGLGILSLARSEGGNMTICCDDAFVSSTLKVLLQTVATLGENAIRCVGLATTEMIGYGLTPARTSLTENKMFVDFLTNSLFSLAKFLLNGESSDSSTNRLPDLTTRPRESNGAVWFAGAQGEDSSISFLEGANRRRRRGGGSGARNLWHEMLVTYLIDGVKGSL